MKQHDNNDAFWAPSCSTEEQEIEAFELVKLIAALTPYGDGPDELSDSEDAALVLNTLITRAEGILHAQR